MNAATDRSWQIELERWRSEGRTAEMLGADGLHWDRFARQARLDDTARRCFDRLDADTRRWCDSYVAGINQALADGLRGGPEFEESGTAPAPWNPWTPLGVFLVQHILFSTFPNKLFRAHVATTLGPDAVGLFSIEAPVWSGSNAWAVHGSATAGGRPLIAGDPHRLLELPGVYQQVRLACPEFDAVGFAFPGVPGCRTSATPATPPGPSPTPWPTTRTSSRRNCAASRRALTGRHARRLSRPAPARQAAPASRRAAARLGTRRRRHGTILVRGGAPWRWRSSRPPAVRSSPEGPTAAP